MLIQQEAMLLGLNLLNISNILVKSSTYIFLESLRQFSPLKDY